MYRLQEVSRTSCIHNKDHYTAFLTRGQGLSCSMNRAELSGRVSILKETSACIFHTITARVAVELIHPPDSTGKKSLLHFYTRLKHQQDVMRRCFSLNSELQSLLKFHDATTSCREKQSSAACRIWRAIKWTNVEVDFRT